MNRIGRNILAVVVAALFISGYAWAGTIRLLSNNQLPRKVLVVNQAETSEFVKELFKTIRKIHEEDGLTGKDAFKLHIVDTAGSLATPEQREGFFGAAASDVEKFVEINPDFKTRDIWMQDFGEFCTITEGTTVFPAVFDSARDAGLKDFPEWLSKNWDLKLCVNPSSTAGFGDGDSGGNIEVTPDNIMYHGDSMTPECRKFFLQNGYADRAIKLATKWLAVGHVDEYLAIVPTEYSPCGYSIVRADPCYALEVLKKATDSDFDALPEPYASFLPRIQAALLNPEEWKGTQEATFIELNRKIGEIIETNIARFVSEIRRITGDTNREIPVVAWPNLFKGRDPAWPSGCSSYTPGVVNHLILRGHLIVPDPLFPPFRKLIKSSFPGQGNRVHFLNDLGYHNLKGDIHCGTNVQRDPNRSFLTAPALASIASLRANFEQLHSTPSAN